MQGQGLNINPLGDAYTGTRDALGRGVQVPGAVAQDNVAMYNQKSLSPMFKNVQNVAIGGSAPMAAQGEEEETPSDKKKKTNTAAYESESFDFDSMFDGQNLSEEFKERMKVVFEAAVNEKVNTIAEGLVAQANTMLEQQVQEISEGLSQKLDDYLNYVVEEWMSENKLALEEGIKMDIAESFLNGLKELFESHYVSVPEGRVDVLENLVASKEELEQEINERVEENIKLQKALLEHQCGIAFLESTHGLTDVQIEKLASLSQGLQYENVEQYVDKLNILKETYFRPVAQNTRQAVESLEESTDKRISQTNDSMGMYLTAIQRQSKKQV